MVTKKGPGTFFGVALGPQSVEAHSLFCPHPLTFDTVAAREVELLDRHALKHLNVAWGTDWGCREGVRGNEKGSWEGSSDEALGPRQLLL